MQKTVSNKSPAKPKAASELKPASVVTIEDQPTWIRNILMCALTQPDITLQNLKSRMEKVFEVVSSLTVDQWDKILFRVTNDKKLFPLFLYQLRTNAPVGNHHKEHVTEMLLSDLGLEAPVTYNSNIATASTYIDSSDFGIEITDPFACGVLTDEDDAEGIDKHYEVLSCSPEAFILRLVIEANKNTILQRDIANAGFIVLNMSHK